MLPVSMAQSSSDMLTLGRIAYCREGAFFPIEIALSAGKGGMGGYLRLPCYYRIILAVTSQCTHALALYLSSRITPTPLHGPGCNLGEW